MNELKSWQEEKGSAHLYRVVAGKEADTARQKLFLELAGEAEKAGSWFEPAELLISFRSRAISWFRRGTVQTRSGVLSL